MDFLGQRLKEIRKEQSLTQTEFGSLFGLSHSHISNIENGRERPSETLILFICSKFNINRKWLVDGIGDRWPNVDITTDEGNRSRFEFYRQSIEYIVRKTTGSDLKYIVNSVSWFENCISHNIHLSGQDKTDYLKSISILFENVETLTADAAVIQSISAHKPDYKTYLRYKNKVDVGMQNISKQLKKAISLFLKEHDIDLGF